MLLLSSEQAEGSTANMFLHPFWSLTFRNTTEHSIKHTDNQTTHMPARNAANDLGHTCELVLKILSSAVEYM